MEFEECISKDVVRESIMKLPNYKNRHILLKELGLIWMAKLQRIDRKDGSSVFSVTIPKLYIMDLGWEKKEELIIEVTGDKIEIKKE